jgi:hypothetical protein
MHRTVSDLANRPRNGLGPSDVLVDTLLHVESTLVAQIIPGPADVEG